MLDPTRHGCGLVNKISAQMGDLGLYRRLHVTHGLERNVNSSSPVPANITVYLEKLTPLSFDHASWLLYLFVFVTSRR